MHELEQELRSNESATSAAFSRVEMALISLARIEKV
jgi:hypothetical protein